MILLGLLVTVALLVNRAGDGLSLIHIFMLSPDDNLYKQAVDH